MFFAILVVMFVGFALWSWRRTRDFLHPGVIFPPMLLFLYVWMPLTLIQENEALFSQFVGSGHFLYQVLIALLTASLFLGIALGSRGRSRPYNLAQDPLLTTRHRYMWRIALLLALAATGSWLWGVYNAGGFSGAYGTAYGGARLASGYARELDNAGLLGVLLVYVARRGRTMRPVDWLLVGICLLPTIGHALLGARRGPTFMAAVVAGAGYLFIMDRRIRLMTVLVAGFALGSLMLFLVANRSQIYLGSDIGDLRSGFDFLTRWNSNEYLIGNAVVAYTQEAGGFYGLRQLAHLIGRLVPSFLWPSVYEDVTALFGLDINLKRNAGVDAAAIAQVSGWQPTVGSATGFVGAMWLEFHYVAPFVAALLGWLYGVAWKRSKRDPRVRIFYILLAAVSVYLVMQDTDAWLYRVIMFYILVRLLVPVDHRRRVRRVTVA